MKISVYTSCSLNYLPKARALAESLAAVEPQASLTLCLNDVLPDWLDPAAELVASQVIERLAGRAVLVDLPGEEAAEVVADEARVPFTWRE